MNLITRKLEQTEWQTYFDDMSGELQKKQAFIEVASLSIGDQVESDWTQLLGITYDHKDNLFAIAVEGVEHMVRNPKEVHVACNDESVEAIEIKDMDDVKHIVKLREPVVPPVSESPA